MYTYFILIQGHLNGARDGRPNVYADLQLDTLGPDAGVGSAGTNGYGQLNTDTSSERPNTYARLQHDNTNINTGSDTADTDGHGRPHAERATENDSPYEMINDG